MDDTFLGFDGAKDLMTWVGSFSPNMREAAMKMREAVYNLSKDIPDMISKILPIALPVLGISIAVFFGIKFIKKIMR